MLEEKLKEHITMFQYLTEDAEPMGQREQSLKLVC